MLCSTVIPTIGRSTLSKAVESVLTQSIDKKDFEIIVVNDSGKSLIKEDWMGSPQVKILQTNRHNRSVARNTGAAISRGKYLHFLDDDDWMLPNAFQSLSEVVEKNNARWIYGAFQLIDNKGNLIVEIVPSQQENCFIQVISSEWIPIQASWIDSHAFFNIGGFASLYSLYGGYEDIDLARLIASKYNFARTAEAVACIRFGDISSTTDYNNMFIQNRLSREKCLDLPLSFSRLLESALMTPKDTAYWHGRIVYFYFASILWNIKHKQITKATSRFAYSLLGIITAGKNLFSTTFWSAVSKPHHNLVRYSLEKAGNDLFRNTDWKR